MLDVRVYMGDVAFSVSRVLAQYPSWEDIKLEMIHIFKECAGEGVWDNKLHILKL